MAWYKVGTVSVAQGAYEVTGVGTRWSLSVMPGDAVTFDGGDKLYEIAAVSGDTSLTLATVYAGPSLANHSYAVIRNASATTNATTATRLSNVLETFEAASAAPAESAANAAAALASAQAAEGSATAAAGSEAASARSEQDAAQHALDATTSGATAVQKAAEATAAAATATAKADDAAGSATAAGASATTASTAADTATSQAAAADASATGAAGSATAAALSAQAATDKADVATTAAQTATDKAADAAGSATIATDKAGLASTAADIATAQATAAGTSATQAAVSAETAARNAAFLPPAGTIAVFAGALPDGWLACDGSAVARAAYPELFLAIGTAYGIGDGATTFGLPRLGQRVLPTADGTDSFTVDLEVEATDGEGNPVTETVQVTVPAATQRWAIRTTASAVPPGTIQLCAGAAPAGWLACDGATVNRDVYPALFGVIGHSYGGDGRYFALPLLPARRVPSSGGTPTTVQAPIVAPVVDGNGDPVLDENGDPTYKTSYQDLDVTLTTMAMVIKT